MTTHSSINYRMGAELIDWDQCTIEAWSNGIVVLRYQTKGWPWPESNTLIAIAHEDLGGDAIAADLVARAEPIFKTMVSIHNSAATKGKEVGRIQKTTEIRAVLEL